MLDRERGPLPLPIAVEDLEEHALRLIFDLILLLLAGNVLVHETQAILVEIQKRCGSNRRHVHASSSVRSSHPVDHWRVVLLNGGSDPIAELEAVALINGIALDVVIGPPYLHLVLDDGGTEEFDKVGVRGVLSRRKDNSLLGGCLDVFAGFRIAGVHDVNAITCFLELFGEAAEPGICQSGVNDHLPIGVKDELLIGKTGDGARIARERLLLEVVALGQGHKIRGDVLL